MTREKLPPEKKPSKRHDIQIKDSRQNPCDEIREQSRNTGENKMK
jgi:hypothetical protein